MNTAADSEKGLGALAVRIPQMPIVRCPEDGQRLVFRARIDRPNCWGKARMALKEAEDVPSNSVL